MTAAMSAIAEAVDFARPGVDLDALRAEPAGEERPQVGREQPADDRREQVQPERRLGPERVVGVRYLAVHSAVVERRRAGVVTWNCLPVQLVEAHVPAAEDDADLLHSLRAP